MRPEGVSRALQRVAPSGFRVWFSFFFESPNQHRPRRACQQTCLKRHHGHVHAHDHFFGMNAFPSDVEPGRMSLDGHCPLRSLWVHASIVGGVNHTHGMQDHRMLLASSSYLSATGSQTICLARSVSFQCLKSSDLIQVVGTFGPCSSMATGQLGVRQEM